MRQATTYRDSATAPDIKDSMVAGLARPPGHPETRPTWLRQGRGCVLMRGQPRTARSRSAQSSFLAPCSHHGCQAYTSHYLLLEEYAAPTAHARKIMLIGISTCQSLPKVDHALDEATAPQLHASTRQLQLRCFRHVLINLAAGSCPTPCLVWWSYTSVQQPALGDALLLPQLILHLDGRPSHNSSIFHHLLAALPKPAAAAPAAAPDRPHPAARQR